MQSEARVFEVVRGMTGLQSPHRHPLTYLVEAADDIAYGLADISDALKKQIATLDQLEGALSHLKTDEPVSWGLARDHLLDRAGVGASREDQQHAFQHFRAIATGRMSGMCVSVFDESIDQIMAGDLGHRALVEVSESKLHYAALEEFAVTNVYGDRDIVIREQAGFKVVSDRLDVLVSDLQSSRSPLTSAMLSPTPVVAERHETSCSPEYLLVQRAVDFVSGMTDSFAITLHRRLTGVTV